MAGVIAAQRAWLRDVFTSQLKAAGRPRPERVGDMLLLLRDGAMASGHVGDPATVQGVLREAATALISAGQAAATPLDR